MALLPNRDILDGTKLPATTTSDMKTALGSLRDYLAGLLGTDSTDKAAARAALGSTAVGDAVFIAADAAAARTALGAIDSATATATAAVAAGLSPISASVAANALTASLAACTLSFRSATLSSGTPSSVVVPSTISVVAPDGATFGTVSARASRLAILAINNAGTVELAFSNVAGGVNLDETTLISTTAISAASDLSTGIYSTSARTGVAFRVVGIIESTQATAGTWASAPSLVQGAGGLAVAGLSGLGQGQTWQSFFGSRVSGTTYVNTTGRPIYVSVWSTAALSSQTNTEITVNGVVVMRAVSSPPSGGLATTAVSAIVPPGGTYSAVAGGTSAALVGWAELR